MAFQRISVVIPAYNAQETIGEALKALMHQTFPGTTEIIVADDGSTDGTRDVVARYQGVRYVYQENAGPASARNRGAMEASGEVILFTDSDCRPSRDWVRKMVDGFTSEDIGVVAGSYGIANPGSILARVIHAEIMFRHQHLMPLYPRAFGSYNFAIWRKLFFDLGGFSVGYRQASGEDNDLSYRVVKSGKRILFLKDATVDHFHQEDLARYLKEQFRHGFWRVRMYADHPQMVVGDDYTFWKDIVEVPWAVLHGLVFFFPELFLLIPIFMVFELVWGWVMARNFIDGMAAGVGMWLRAFARMFGFFCGGLYFFKYIFSKVKKN